MYRITIDGQDIFDRTDLHDYLAYALDFPEYYGRNLDALHDLLMSHQEKLEIQIIHFDELHDHLGHYADHFLKLLLDVAEKNAFITVLR
jgi:ribonuclease inhibitor